MVQAPTNGLASRRVSKVNWDSHDDSPISLVARRDLLTAAFKKDPEKISVRRALAHLHCDMGSHEEAIEIAGLHPADPELQYLLGKALLAKGQHETAETALRSAYAKGFSLARLELAETLDRLGLHSEAWDICDDHIRSEPESIAAFRLMGHQLLGQGDAPALRQLCDRFRGSAQLSTLRQTFEIAASQLAGDIGPRELTEMHQAQTQLTDLTNQDWYTDYSRADLVRELASHPNSMNVAHRQSTKRGTRVAELLANKAAVISKLAEAVKRQAETYLETRAAPLLDAPIAAQEKTLALNMWAVMLNDGGYQEWHMHPGALISGVFYVDVPESSAGMDSMDGWLEFGTANNRYSGDGEWTYPIKPENGLLVIFPSAFMHRTRPHSGSRQRISIAFDVVPQS